MPSVADSWIASSVDDAEVVWATGVQATDQLTARQRYALDPFALLDEGHVRIQQELGELAVFRIFDHQRDTGTSWIDWGYLRETGRLRFNDLLVEKSRQMGETWILAWLVLWAVAFHTPRLLVQHLRQAKVDDGGERSTVASFFGKVRFLWLHTNWEAAGLERPRLRFNPFAGGRDAMIRNDDRPGALVTGSGQSDDPGRGDTLDGYIGDEFAHIERTEKVHESVSRSCPSGKVYNSTPHGQSNAFYRLRRDRPAGWTVKRYHWSHHPTYGAGAHTAGDDEACEMCRATRRGVKWPGGGHRYPGKITSAWYEAAVADMTDEQVARQLDIDYVGSLEARVWPEWQPETHIADRRLFDPALPVVTGWDFGWSDYTSIVICQDAPDSIRVVGELETNHALPEHVAAGLCEVLRGLGIAHPLTREWTRQLLCVADYSGSAKSAQTGASLWDTYATHGWVMSGRFQLIAPTIVAVGRLLLGHPKPLLASAVDAPKFCEHIANATWPTDSEGKRRPGATEPLHDEHSHMTSAFRYLVSHKYPPPVDDQAMPPPPADPGPPLPSSVFKPGMAF